MYRKMRYLLLVLVLIVPLALAACGGDDDDKDDNGGGNGDVELSQTFESETGATVNYPEGWVAMENGGQIVLANSQALMDKMQDSTDIEAKPEKGEAGVVLSVMPLAALGLEEGAELDTIFDMMVQGMTSEGMEAEGDAQSIKVGDSDAKRLDVKLTDEGGEGMVVFYINDAGALVMAILATADDERGTYDDLALKIAESVTWTAPAAE